VGVISGQEREVDITLRSHVGTTPVLIAIECRDRKIKSDVTWIEQLNTKKRDIQASKMIAVSSSGFSEAAAAVARVYGIETRTLRSLAQVQTFDWIEGRELASFNLSCQLIDVTILVSSPPEQRIRLDFPGGRFSADDPIFFRKTDRTPASVDDLVDRRWISRMSLGIPLDTPYHLKAFLRISNPEAATALRCSGESVDVSEIILTLEIFRTQSTVAIDRLYEYADEDRTIAQGFDVRVPDGQGSKLVFHRSGDGKKLSINIDRANVEQRTRRPRRSPIFWTPLEPEGH
jgi:hypothetical protein